MKNINLNAIYVYYVYGVWMSCSISFHYYIKIYECIYVCSYLILICCSNRIWQQANCLLGALFRREEIKDQFVRMNGVSNSISLCPISFCLKWMNDYATSLLFHGSDLDREELICAAEWLENGMPHRHLCESEQKGNLSWNYILCNKNANKTISMSNLFRYISCWMENIVFVRGESKSLRNTRVGFVVCYMWYVCD